MKSFLVKCALFAAGFFILDKSLILLRNSLPDRELDKRLEYLINGKISADIVVIGSSRGARDIVASQMADSLNTSVYNLSYPGSDISFHEYLVSCLLKYSDRQPNVIVLVVDDPYELMEDPNMKFRYDRLYPLVKYKAIRETLIEKGEKNAILSKLFVIHQLSVGSFDLRKKHFNSQDTLLSDGSMPISWQSKKFNINYASERTVYDPSREKDSKLQSLSSVIKMCRNNNIELILACAPNFGKPTIGFEQRIASLAGPENHVMHYDTTNSVYKNADYYFDPAHLRLNGATVFTSELSDFIRRNGIKSYSSR